MRATNSSRRLRLASVSRSTAWSDFFFSRRPNFFSRCQIRPRLSEMPDSVCSFVCSWASVRSGFDATQSITCRCTSIPARHLRPGWWGTRSGCPVRFRCAEIFFAQPTLTRKRSASSSSVSSPLIVGRQKFTAQVISIRFPHRFTSRRVSPNPVYTITEIALKSSNFGWRKW